MRMEQKADGMYRVNLDGSAADSLFEEDYRRERVLQAIENRVGAKLVPEMLENLTSKEQYDILEMNRISGFVNRARGTGRPTKKDRRELDDFRDADVPLFFDDSPFDLDDDE